MLIVDKEKKEAVSITGYGIKVIKGKKLKKAIKEQKNRFKKAVDMVQCPNCNGRGQIGYGIKGACFDFECPYCKGRCWVSKKRAEKYGRDTQAERKGTTAGVEKTLKRTGA